MSERRCPKCGSVYTDTGARFCPKDGSMLVEIQARKPPTPASPPAGSGGGGTGVDRKSTRLNSSHSSISYAVFCVKKKMLGPTYEKLGVLFERLEVVQRQFPKQIRNALARYER